MSENKLTSGQHSLLQEALRRYVQFHPGEGLAEVWTGLGNRSTYKPVLKAGLMEWVKEPAPRCIGWLRLTEAGAVIVQGWLKELTKPTMVDEILGREEELQYLAQPPSMIALKAVTEILQEHGYVVITKSLYRELSERPVRATEEVTK